MSEAPTPAVRIRHRAKPHRRRVSMLSSAAAGMGGLEAATAGGPRLVLADPEDRRSTWIAGSLTTLLHAGAIGILILLAWLAPPVEELIEVKIIRELPGADVKPAPARKIIQPRRQRTPVQAARRVTAQAVAQPRVMNVQPQQLNMQQLNRAQAPQQVQRRQVVSNRTQARSIDQRRVATNVDLSKLQNVQVAPTDLQAPTVDYDGPRQIDPGAAIQDPQSFANVPRVQDTDYRSAGPVAVVSDEDLSAAGETFDFDTDVGIYAGGEGSGGTGSAEGVVPCFQSAFVIRYMKDVEQRTHKRWQVPEGVPADTEVRLRFMLDSSGNATQVEYVGDTDPVLGNSAVAALRAASPFPPMNDNVRCMANKKLRGTFSVPAL
jgi:hypothetical protein